MTLNEQKAALAKLLPELKAAEQKMSEGKLTESESAEVVKKMEEAKSYQDAIDAAERLSSFNKKNREVAETHMPAVKDSKSTESDESDVVGYMSVGDMFTKSEQYKNFLREGAPKAGMKAVQFKGLRDKYIPITKQMVESKAVPTIDTGVIRPNRIAAVVQETADDKLRLRDVLNVSQTDSSSVEYLVEDEYTLNADVVAESTAKPETDYGLSLATAPVRTIAVHIPVTEQQLMDVPQIRNLIDNRLMYDLRRTEEKQFLYGSGVGQNLTGILPLSSVPSITRTVTDITDLDRIRLGISDISVAGGEANAVVIHPYDWDEIALLKDDNKNYIWTIVTDANTGNSRVWGIQVVETVAAKNPASAQRYMLVGDFKRGATVWDRQAATIDVGYIDDQFILNQRTIRAEERLAFGVHNPKWFAKYETNAA